MPEERHSPPEVFAWCPGLAPFALILAWPLFFGVTMLLVARTPHPPTVPLPIWGLHVLPAIAVLQILLGMRNYALVIGDHAIEMRCGPRIAWSLPRHTLTSVRYEPGSWRAFNRLVLVSAGTTRTITLEDRVFGRWSDPARIRELLRAHGDAA